MQAPARMRMSGQSMDSWRALLTFGACTLLLFSAVSSSAWSIASGMVVIQGYATPVHVEASPRTVCLRLSLPPGADAVLQDAAAQLTEDQREAILNSNAPDNVKDAVRTGSGANSKQRVRDKRGRKARDNATTDITDGYKSSRQLQASSLGCRQWNEAAVDALASAAEGGTGSGQFGGWVSAAVGAMKAVHALTILAGIAAGIAAACLVSSLFTPSLHSMVHRVRDAALSLAMIASAAVVVGWATAHASLLDTGNAYTRTGLVGRFGIGFMLCAAAALTLLVAHVLVCFVRYKAAAARRGRPGGCCSFSQPVSPPLTLPRPRTRPTPLYPMQPVGTQQGLPVAVVARPAPQGALYPHPTAPAYESTAASRYYRTTAAPSQALDRPMKMSRVEH